MSKIKCIIIEDEPLAQERVRGYVSKIPNLELLGSFENGIDALFFLKSNEVDLLFLDINIGEFYNTPQMLDNFLSKLSLF